MLFSSKMLHMDAKIKTRKIRSSAFNDSCRNYYVIADALQFLGERWYQHPDYKQAAAAAGLSPHHFHKVFTRWAGISPKRYVGALAHDAARKVLETGGSVEEASFEAGLSGSSRLHDLFVRHEALSPGEAKSKAADVHFTWGVAESPFGLAFALVSPRGLSAYAFFENGQLEATFADISSRYPKALYTREDQTARDITAKIFAGGVLPVALYGTKFQLQVWKALLAIPTGETVQYKDIANAIKNPEAVRAVGAAIGANPIGWVIPCHRVLGSDRRLTGYHWGVERKRAMLAYEDMQKKQHAT